jgi:hypothetical protein
MPSNEFYKRSGGIFDEWGICRTRAGGEDGFFQQVSESQFRPVIVSESLGDNIDLAYRLGEALEDKYPDLNQRAEMAFSLVKNRVRYTPDIDQFGVKEFAQNADELAKVIRDKGIASGDCEDSSIFLAVVLKGAGLRSAIVLMPGHAATLVYLPDYKKGNQVFELDGEEGWIWAEATAPNNPLGWMPERFVGERLLAYEISAEKITTASGQAGLAVAAPQGGGGGFPLQISPFMVVVGVMFLLSLFRRRRTVR